MDVAAATPDKKAFAEAAGWIANTRTRPMLIPLPAREQ